MLNLTRHEHAPVTSSERERLIAQWRHCVSTAKTEYEQASALVLERGNDQKFGGLPLSDGHLAYRQALRAESAARNEYARVLKLLTNLLLYGTKPNERG